MKKEEKKEEKHQHHFQFIRKEKWVNGLNQTDGKIYALFMCSCGEKKRRIVE